MIKIFIRQEVAFNRTELYIFDEKENGERHLAQPFDLTFQPWDDYSVPKPSLVLNGKRGSQFLTELAKALIESGYRDKAVDVRGEIKRMEDHLADMRKLVFRDN